MAAVLGLTLAGTAVADVGLGAYQWENRLVLSFRPTLADGYAQATAAARREALPAWRERDLILIEIGPGAMVQVDAAPAHSLSADALRRAYGVDPGEHAAILIGKDGSEKLRLDTAMTNAQLFPLIDSMPMRRQEMRQR